MQSLWFKGRYVAAILAGEKTDTVRLLSARRRYAVGETVGLSVGARPPFAVATVTAVEDVDLAALPVAKRAELRGLYGDALGGDVPGPLRRIAFTLRPAP